MEFCDVELQKTVSRTLHYWPVLTSYFSSHEDRTAKVEKLTNLLVDPEVKLDFMFLDFILAPLNEFNTSFHADASKLGLLQQQTTVLLRRFLWKFVRSAVIQQHRDLSTVPYDDRANQIDDEKLAVGLTAQTYIEEIQDDIKLSALGQFFRTVRQFYIAVVAKMIGKFPLHDPTLANVTFLVPGHRANITSESVLQLADRFKIIKEEKDSLQEEILDFQLAAEEEIPKQEEVQKFWVEVGNLVDLFTNKSRFPLLCKVAKTCLVIPVSNADSERMFSFLKRIYTDYRSELKNDNICALMSAKQNSTCD